MHGRRAMRVLKLGLLGVVAVAVIGYVVMGLWNWVMPPLFGLRAIGFWQALGLLVLSRILVGGMSGGGGHDRHWRKRMMDRWERMTPEEREQLRSALRTQGGRSGEPEPESTT